MNQNSTMYKENAVWSDSSFGESPIKMEPVLSKNESYFFSPNPCETSIAPIIPKFKFLKKGSRNPFTVVPKNEKKCYRYYSASGIEQQSKDKVA
jgi:hypothetical protein